MSKRFDKFGKIWKSNDRFQKCPKDPNRFHEILNNSQKNECLNHYECMECTKKFFAQALVDFKHVNSAS